MLKSNLVLVAGLFLISHSAMAAKVGDSATLSFHSVEGGFTLDEILINEVLKVEDSGDQLVRTTMRTEGNVGEVRERIFSTTDTLSESGVAKLIANCAGEEGVFETVTVPAGTFDVCTMPLDDQGVRIGRISIANIPFGIVRVNNKIKDKVMKIELIELKKN